MFVLLKNASPSRTRYDIVRWHLPMYVLAVASLLPMAAKVSALASDAAEVELPVGEGERLLIIAPHPDDETLGAAGLAQRVLARGGSVRTLVLTAGDGFVEAVQQQTGQATPRPADFVNFGRQRILEANAAARVLSSRGIRVDVLGFPDGGLLPLLFAHWNHLHPERSPTTGQTRVPYRNALDHRLAYAGADLRGAMAQVLRKFKPTLVAFTDPLDEHPDHRATGMFALLGVSDWMRTAPDNTPWPRMLAFLVHWKKWPPDSGEPTAPSYIVDRPLTLPIDLPLRNQDRHCLTLTDEELRQKQSTLAQYKTQQDVLGPFLASFVRRNECYSINTQLNAQDVDAEIGNRIYRRLRVAGGAGVPVQKAPAAP